MVALGHVVPFHHVDKPAAPLVSSFKLLEGLERRSVSIVRLTTRVLRSKAVLAAVRLLLAIALPSVAHAQVVRGTVVERTTGAALVGVIVELAPATGGAGRVA
ncbi:MAG: hypothetical protein ABIT38_24180, partial [Gemmatimonadaceae bacterium]